MLADAVALEAKGKVKLPLSHRGKSGKTTSPLDDTHITTNRRYMSSAFKTALGRAAIVLTQGSPTPHELRDSFLTRAIQTGCSPSAANFVMGHVIDRLGYDKSSRDEKWLWSELSKIQGPAAVTEDALTSRDQEIELLKFQMQQLDETVRYMSQWTQALEVHTPEATIKALRRKMTSKDYFPTGGLEDPRDLEIARHQIARSGRGKRPKRRGRKA